MDEPVGLDMIEEVITGHIINNVVPIHVRVLLGKEYDTSLYAINTKTERYPDLSKYWYTRLKITTPPNFLESPDKEKVI